MGGNPYIRVERWGLERRRFPTGMTNRWRGGRCTSHVSEARLRNGVPGRLWSRVAGETLVVDLLRGFWRGEPQILRLRAAQNRATLRSG